MKSSSPTKYGVIVLGDQDTGRQVDVLAAKAAEHNASIAEIHTFDSRQLGSADDLIDVDAVVTAIGRAIATMTPVWIPFPMEDFTREQHLRRISLVLQLHRMNLFLGQHLWLCPPEGGMNEIDFALRREVIAVDELNNAVLAAAAWNTLGQEIEEALVAISSAESSEYIRRQEANVAQIPALPPPTAPWPQRRPALKNFACWLVRECGLSQTHAANVINTIGHRTPRGHTWQQPSISALINNRYDPGAAA